MTSPTKTVHDALEHLKIGDPVIHGQLAMFPLLDARKTRPERDYLTLTEAMENGTAKVREVSASGTVPNLTFENSGDKPVLLVEGEALKGAKQDRTLNVSIFAKAGQSLNIPVSCVEAGRWGYRRNQRHAYETARLRELAHHCRLMEMRENDEHVEERRSMLEQRAHRLRQRMQQRQSAGDPQERSKEEDPRELHLAEATHFAKGRRAKVASVNASMAAYPGNRRSDQSQVWNDVGGVLNSTSTDSPTSSMFDAYEMKRKAIQDYIEAFAQQPKQVGAVFVVADGFAGADLVEHEWTFAEIFPKLVRGYAMEAIRSGSRHRPATEPGEKADQEVFSPSPSMAKEFMAEIVEASSQAHEAVGLGQDIRIDSPTLTGAALTVDNRVLHLASFRKDDDQPHDYQRHRA